MRYNSSNLTFQYKNHSFNYCINSHNTRGYLTERIIEIPLLDYALSKMHNPIEIGCVSPYYWDTTHEIYDLTDTHPSCKNINAKDINFKERDIISVSTIEHFDMENYDINSSEYINSIHYIKLLVKYSNKYFITFPLGYNPKLTEFILTTDTYNASFIARQSNNLWIDTPKQLLTTEQLRYNTDIWYANSIAIMENIF